MRRGIIALLTLFAVLTISTTAKADVKITTENYKGWAGCFRLTNGTVEVVVVPAVGRIMRYGFIGEPNALWENKTLSGKPPKPGTTWSNIGGDKIWPWSQDDWQKRTGTAWPPPVAADQAAHQGSIIGKDTVRLISPLIIGYGARIVRDITLAPTGSGVTIVSRVEKVGNGTPFPVSAWSVCQITPPDLIVARRVSASPLPNGYKKMADGDWKRIEPSGEAALIIERPTKNTGKLGIDGDVLAARHGDTLMTVHSRTASKATGFVPGDRAQIWTQSDTPEDTPDGVTAYVELECTAPLMTLAKGDASILETVWELHHLKPEERDPASVVRFVQTLP